MNKCILCKNKKFKKEIDLGKLYQSMFVPEDFNYKSIDRIEHKIVSCKNCGFVQMSETPERDSMYREYWYRSALNSSMVEALKDIVDNAQKLISVENRQKKVLDIACFKSDSQITMSDFSLKNISDIKIGDEIISAEGNIRKVSAIMNRNYSGEFIKIRTIYNYVIESTPEHPVLSMVKGEIKYREIRSLGINDYLAIPKNIVDSETSIDNDRLLIYGWYLAEGHLLYSHKPKICGIGLTLNIDEENDAQEILSAAKRLGYNCSETLRPEKSVRALRIYSKEFAEEINELLGRYSKHKVLHPKIFKWSLDNKLKLLKYYFRGDGHLRNQTGNSYQYYISSANKKLLMDIKTILLQLSVPAYFYEYRRKKDGGMIYSLTIGGLKINTFEDYVKECRSYVRFKEDDKNFYFPIKNISRSTDCCLVYNLTVENDNSYIANGVGVHNCNDGTSLSLYPQGWFRVGVDPANNLAKYYTQDNCNIFINDYFTSNLHFKDKFDIITSIAVFYDLLDPYNFVKGVTQNLDDKGVWIMQMTCLLSTIKCFSFDNTTPEHVAYWTLKQFCDIISKFGLEVFRVEYNSVNGHSLRAYVQHKGYRPVEDNVGVALKEEEDYLLANPLKKFGKEMVKCRDKLRILLDNLQKEGMVVGGLGASTKGNTTLQYFGLTSKQISWIGEVSEEKVGRYTIGSHIPIISEKDLFERNPPYIFVLIWQFTDFLLQKHKDYLDNGGKFIIPMPVPKIVSRDGEQLL